MKIIKNILLIVLILFIASVSTLSAEQLLKSSTSWNGASLAYPKGELEFTVVKRELKKGEIVDFHCHLVPSFVYILKGVVDVETLNKEKATFKQGDTMLEVVNTIHKGIAKASPTEILVFFVGSKSIGEHTIPAGSKQAKKYCI